MMKSLLALAIVSLVCACSNEQEKYLKVIPDDATFAMSFNCASLAQKGELGSDLALKGAESLLLLQLDQETQTFAQELLDDPSKSGIDFTKPLVATVGGNLAAGDAESVIVLAVKDKAALQKAVETFSKSAGLETSTSGDVVTIDKEGLGGSVAFDGSSLVFLVSKSRKAADLMNLPKDQQAVYSDPYFAPSVAGKADMAFYFNYDHLFSMLPQAQLAESGISEDMLQLYKDVNLCSTTNFENGKIVTDCKLYNGEKLKEMSKIYNREATGKHFDYVPEKAMAVLSFGIQNIADLIKLYPANVQEAVDNFFEQNGSKTSDLNDIEGDVTFAFSGIENNFAQFLFAFDCNADSVKAKSDKYKQETDKLIEAGMLEKVSDNFCSFLIPNTEYKIYGGDCDNTFYLMDESMFNQLVKDNKVVKLSTNFSTNPLSAQIKKGGMAIDFKPMVPMVETLMEDHPYQAITTNVLSKFDNIVITGDMENYSSSMVIQMTDTKKNSLRQLIDLGEGLATGK